MANQLYMGIIHEVWTMKYTFELIGIDEYNICKNGKLYAKGQLPIMTEVFRNIELTLKMQE